ncbi:MAG: 30S ribosomal protein S16 [bacterium]|nr:30S ribosomal protein S16 [bacterium]
MAVVIRMKRTGRRNRPCYRISVADSRFPRDGRTLETLGLYDPVSSQKDKQTTLDVDRARHWIGAGALPSETVRSIFKRMGVYEDEFALGQGKKRDRSGRKKATKKGTVRKAAKAGRAGRKDVRRTERSTARRAAAKAAKAAEGEGGDE